MRDFATVSSLGGSDPPDTGADVAAGAAGAVAAGGVATDDDAPGKILSAAPPTSKSVTHSSEGAGAGAGVGAGVATGVGAGSAGFFSRFFVSFTGPEDAIGPGIGVLSVACVGGVDTGFGSSVIFF